MNNLQALEEMIEHGVPSTLNISIRDYVSDEYPLRVPFHIEETTKEIKTKLHYVCSPAEHALERELHDVRITVFVDGIERITVNDILGSIDLSDWITVPEWHEITIQTNLLVKIMGHLSVRSGITM